ncbi:hypothetical protein JCM14469_18530 [Desulfatiferula olefinivorans]
MKHRPIPTLFFAVLIGMFALAALPGRVTADTPGVGTDDPVTVFGLEQSIDQALDREKVQVETFRRELADVKERERSIGSELATLKVQYSIYSNLLIMPETPVRTLEQSFTGNVAAQGSAGVRTADFKDKREKAQVLLTQTDDQIRLNDEQLTSIRAHRNPGPDAQVLIEKLRQLLDQLNRKKKILEQLAVLYEAYERHYAELRDQFSALSGTFDREIRSRRKQNLIQRTQNVLFSKTPDQMLADLAALRELPGTLMTELSAFRALVSGSDISGPVILGLLFVFLQYVLFKMSRALPRLDARPFFQSSVWAAMALAVIRRSLFLTGNSLFLIACGALPLVRVKYPMIVAAEQMLTIVLLSRWIIDILTFFPSDQTTFLSRPIRARLKGIVRLIRLYALVYVPCVWLLDSDHMLPVLLRVVFAVLLYVRLIGLAKLPGRMTAPSERGPRTVAVVSALPVSVTVLMFAGLIFDLAGYTPLVLFVGAALCRTGVVAAWAVVFFLILKDYKKTGHALAEGDSDDGALPVPNAHWFMSLVFSLVWFVCVFLGIIYVWGGKQAVAQGIYTGYTTPLRVGDMSFSLMGVTAALVLLVITHGASRLWRDLLQRRLLTDSGMDIGVRESIATISTYLIWIVGILMALNVFGLNMTSITVVLGALGIGLGFGLQNIFNNFLSGIILLFERPIQVGDDVEINGTWANVRKINVRSTVVQTYDNATLIIPNSDFISNQVTNWSFKDKRLRRNITVGVAYGSDLDKVRDTLLGVADTTPRVLRLPKPDVIFKDFGDSALIFVLRIWTRVEYFYSVESALRFEIDRLFRQRGIEIAFPQMDLHLRSIPPEPVVSLGDDAPPEGTAAPDTP